MDKIRPSTERRLRAHLVLYNLWLSIHVICNRKLESADFSTEDAKKVKPKVSQYNPHTDANLVTILSVTAL